MAKPVVLSEDPVTMAQVQVELNKIKERDGELNFRANKTEEYLQQFSVGDLKQTQELLKKLDDLQIPRLKLHHITKIVDLLPRTLTDVKVILQGYPTLSVNQQAMKKISDTVKEFS